MSSRQKLVDAAVSRGVTRVKDGTHGGADQREVRSLAEIPRATAVMPFDPVRQALFLQALQDKPIVGRAARKAGVTVGMAYGMRKRSEVFAAAWDEALCASVDALEECAIDRAMSKSDKLLEMLLKGMRPETYREKVDALAAMRVNIVVDLVPGLETVDAEGVETVSVELNDEGGKVLGPEEPGDDRGGDETPKHVPGAERSQ